MAQILHRTLAQLFVSAWAIFNACGGDTGKAWEHGRLKADPTGRILIHEDGRPFFWMGDSCWELMHRSTREEVDRYLADRAAKRFNVIQTVAVAEFGGIDQPNRYGHLPFEKTEIYPDGDMGTPRIRPGLNDDYWDHVNYIVDRAAEHGIYVCYVVTWATHVAARHAVDEHNAKAFGSFIGRSMKERPNVVYMLGCDRDAEVGGVDYRRVWRWMAEGIRQEDPNHLVSYLAKYYDTRHWFEGERWLDFNMIQYRGPYDGWDTLNLVAAAYARRPPMPIVNVECNLDGDPHYHKGDSVGADLCRREFYWYVFSGAFGHTYGHLSLITWWDPKRPYKVWFTEPTLSWSEALDAQGAREKEFARNLLESRPLRDRMPDASLIAWGHSDKGDHLEACRGVGYAYVYTPDGKNFAVNLGRISGDEVRAWWFDPRTGAAVEIGRYPNRGSRTFDPPAEPRPGNDWILVLDDAARSYPPPGSIDHPQTAGVEDEQMRAPSSAAAATPVAAGRELVVNGSFEDGATGWILNGAELAPDPNTHGSTALAIKQGTWKSAEQRIPAAPNRRYAVSVRLRSDRCNAPVGVAAIFTDRFGAELGRRLVTPAVWGTTAAAMPYRIQARAPSETRFMDVRLYSNDGGAGHVFFDEISVVDLGP